jgi:arabinan endo-1,5-alpha-L-arabinosidase
MTLPLMKGTHARSLVEKISADTATMARRSVPSPPLQEIHLTRTRQLATGLLAIVPTWMTGCAPAPASGGSSHGGAGGASSVSSVAGQSGSGGQLGGAAQSGGSAQGGDTASGAGNGGTGPGIGGAGAASGGASGSAGAAGGGAGPTLGTLACGTPWSNPAKGDTWAHDPSLTRDGNAYYLFSTPHPVEPPAVRALVPFKSSLDGVTWTDARSVFSAPLDWWNDDIPAPETWAGDVRKVNGTFYVYYSISAWGNFNSSIGLATNTTLDVTSPDYNWVDRGKVVDFRNGGTGVNVIDPNLFVEADGSFWLVYGSFRSGIRLVQLDPSTGKLPAQPDVKVLTNGLGEGSSLLKHGSYYYLVVSIDRCCAALESTYRVVMGRSENIAGPYLTKDGKRLLDGAYTVLLAGDTAHPGQGGQSFYEERGQLYMVYHAYTAPSGDPVLNVRPIFFDSSGWPTLDPCASAP